MSLPVVGALGRGVQKGRGVAGDGIGVAAADDLGVEAGEPLEGCGGLGRVGVEHAQHDLAVGSAGDGVPGDQDPPRWEVEGGAAWGVAGHGDRDGAAAEVQFVTVVQFTGDADRLGRCAGELAGDLVIEGAFPVGQVGGRFRQVAAQERRVGVMGGDLGAGQAAISAAAPAWSAWKWVSTTCRRSAG